jgi:activator of HSP90 ATPase
MQFEIKYDFEVNASTLYSAWLDSEVHSEMTGGEANISAIEGESFDAWDGYIWGVTIKLIPNKYIKQIWRTEQFSENQEDSIIELYFEEIESNKTRIILIHSNLTNSKADKAYEKGWVESYFLPMTVYFSNL